jgi:hypothetical protein
MNTEYIKQKPVTVTKKHGTGELTEPKFAAKGKEL